MEHRDGGFDGAGGLRIAWQAWEGREPARSTVVIAHGVSEHSGRYGHVVERLVPAGHDVYAIDHRGHGRSEGRRVLLDRMDNVVADLDQLVSRAVADHPGRPVFLLGHSLGGCVALAYVLRHQDRLGGLILSAPAAALESASPVVRILSRVLSAVTPGLGVMKVDSGAISRDAAEVRAYEEDPLVDRGKLPARTVAEAAKAIDGFPDRVAEIRVPLLVLHGGEDRLTAVAGSRMVDERAGSEDKTLRVYDGLYHEIFNELPADRARVLDNLVAWLDDHVPAANAEARAG